MPSADSSRSSLDIGTKLDRAPEAGWRFVLYPEAAEGGGSFHGASQGRPGPAPEPGDYRLDAARRARSKVRRYCASNRLNRLGTLTYRGEGCHDSKALREDLAQFFRRLRAEVGGPLPYLWVPEWHPGGHGLHAHFAVGQFIPVGVIREAWGLGHVHITLLSHLPVGSGALGEARLAARYLAKYVGKDMRREEAGGLHRYEVAEGFQPRGHRLSGESADEVIGWASVVMGTTPEHVWRSGESGEWAGPPAVWASWA